MNPVLPAGMRRLSSDPKGFLMPASEAYEKMRKEMKNEWNYEK
jgi:hypothetical protein